MHRDYQPTTIAELLVKLDEASKEPRRGKATKRTFQIINSDKKLIGWKFSEWEYGKDKVHLPSDARGLFTLEDEPKLVVRGYDKFFNIDEVYFTKWSWLEENTEGPYYVTSKENGCIILISALEDGTLVVCSKHSTGLRDDIERNHALAGQRFLEKQLSKIGITAKEFALRLYELNVTAVAEYCDDDFEEHIVEYRGDNAGLYLHGLNLNQPIFETVAIDQVQEFASSYGFRTIDFFRQDNIKDLRQILEECSKTGSFNGKEMEGFVIRCKIKGKGEDYFFKFKFEEPYLMYRQWREVTRQYIQTRDRAEIRITKHKFITHNYLDFVIPLIDLDEQLAKDFLKGYGIIELRQKFLKSYGKTGPEILNQELLDHLDQLNLAESKVDGSTKFVFIPVATIGCGKTTIGLTLTGLEPDNWGIVINDDLPRGKDAVKNLVKHSLNVLQTKKCVVIDKNHHQFRERKETLENLKEMNTNNHIKYICLNFSNSVQGPDIWKVTTERVIKRGDNHQSIKAATDGASMAKNIMSGFIKRFNPVNPSREPDSGFDLVIDLDVNANNSSLDNTKLILKILSENFPLAFDNTFTDEQIQESFDKALEYKPSFTKTFKNKKKEVKSEKDTKKRPSTTINNTSKKRTPVYFSIGLDGTEECLRIIDSILLEKNVKDSLLEKLKLNKRIQDEFHVTLAHVTSGTRGNDEEKTIWKQFIDYLASNKISANELGVLATIQLNSLIWNDKALAILVKPLKFTERSSLKDVNFRSSNKFPHITIGTSSPDIKPYYSNQLAEIAGKYDSKEGVYEDITILHFKEGTTLSDLPVIVNY